MENVAIDVPAVFNSESLTGMLAYLFIMIWLINKKLCNLGFQDDVARWWTGVVGVAAYWLLGEDNQAEKLYANVEAIPESLVTLNDPLPKAVLATFISRRIFLEKSKRMSHKYILQLCDIAGRVLEDSLTYSSCKQTTGMVPVSIILMIKFKF